MARGKKAKTGGKSRSTPGRGQQPPRTPISRGSQRSGRRNDDSSDDYDATPTTRFSLRDAARRPQVQSIWNQGSSFRHQSIGFVRSSGVVSPKTELDTKHGTIPPGFPPAIEQELRPTSASPAQQRLSPSSDGHLEAAEMDRPQLLNNVTTVQSPPQRMPIDTATRIARSDSADSGDEVVVFRGRNGPPPRAAPTMKPTIMDWQPESPPQVRLTSVIHQSLKINQDQLPPNILDVSSLRESLREPSPLAAATSVQTRQRSSSRIASKGTPGLGRKAKQPQNTKRGRKTPHMRSDVEESAVIADYVANMRENGFIDVGENLDDRMESKASKGLEWSPSEIEDFDDFSTSDEVMEALSEIVSKRVRPSGTQYLIVWEGETMDDARWIHEAALTMDGALELISAFEEKEKLIPEYPETDDNESSDDEDVWEGTNDEASEDDGLDSEEDERDLIERKIARMTDEQIARLLAKQEELGLGSDELILFDGNGADSDEEVDLEDFVAFGSSKRNKRNRKSGTPKQNRHLVAVDDMLEGEDYGNFDVMDHERSSLNSGRKLQDEFVSFGLSDSELEINLQATFAADRKRKSARKLEREELRVQGLLGKKNKFKPDLSVKHRDGLSIEQMGQEIEDFLRADHETMALPPMNKKDRKVVHEIANAFNLKSKSAGAGKKRFPVLYKTSRSRDFNVEVFARVQAQVKRRFFNRMDVRGGRAKGVIAGQTRQGGFSGDISYREGDVVGGTAPELAADNRGRAMLEKMGWTTGTALGALNNKGILVPVAHVVKKSRTGLG